MPEHILPCIFKVIRQRSRSCYLKVAQKSDRRENRYLSVNIWFKAAMFKLHAVITLVYLTLVANVQLDLHSEFPVVGENPMHIMGFLFSSVFQIDLKSTSEIM